MNKNRKTILSLKKNSNFNSVSELIALFQNKYPKKYFYKPIGVEVEITNICNLKCRGCSLIVDEIDKPQDILTDEDFIKALLEFSKKGVFAYSLTGGETFLKLETIKKIISTSNLDIYKLNTNGSFFKDKKVTFKILKDLKKSGFGVKNKFIKSVLVLSLGHQNLAGVPLANAVNVTSLFYKIFNSKFAIISLNITEKNTLLSEKIYSDFKKLYKKTTKKEFDEDLFKVRFFSLNNIPTLKRLNIDLGPKATIEELLDDYKERFISGGCFNIRVNSQNKLDEAETLIPRCVLRPNGDLYACPGFNRVHLVGNILEEKIDDIFIKINKNLVLETVFTKNLKGLFKLALKSEPSLKDRMLEKAYGPCDLCQLLTAAINKTPVTRYRI